MNEILDSIAASKKYGDRYVVLTDLYREENIKKGKVVFVSDDELEASKYANGLDKSCIIVTGSDLHPEHRIGGIFL